MTDALPEISETCRCGTSIKITGAKATDARLQAWRDGHRCMSADEVRFRDVPERTGAVGAVTGFAPRWDHDDRPPLR